MASLPLIIDCDPGQDDAINLLLAMSAPDELDILGITTVAGNVPLTLTQRNARVICDTAGRDDIPVFAGCPRPLERALVTAENIHGKTGLGGMDVTEPRHPIEDEHAVDFILATLAGAAPESITLVATGPLTNLATAIARDRSVLPNIDRIVLMGGAMREAGNYSPSAEFNILVDPHAADIVLNCGCPITALGLDVTHQVPATPQRLERIRAIGNDAGRVTAAMLDFYMRRDTVRFGDSGAPLHDPCTIAWLLQPTLFASRQCNVMVETSSELTIGHTAVDFWGVTDRRPNVDWVHQVDADGFFDLLVDRLARFGSR
jgi:purine nucleosidase